MSKAHKLLQEAQHRAARYHTRRHFLKTCTTGLGAIALGSLIACESKILNHSDSKLVPDLNAIQHFAPKAKRVIYLHMAGAPSQLELFDYKPKYNACMDKPVHRPY